MKDSYIYIYYIYIYTLRIYIVCIYIYYFLCVSLFFLLFGSDRLFSRVPEAAANDWVTAAKGSV